ENAGGGTCAVDPGPACGAGAFIIIAVRTGCRVVTPGSMATPSAAASELANSFALGKRWSGLRAAARAHHASKPGGTGATDDGTGMGATMILTSRSPRALLSNGRSPVRQR